MKPSKSKPTSVPKLPAAALAAIKGKRARVNELIDQLIEEGASKLHGSATITKYNLQQCIADIHLFAAQEADAAKKAKRRPASL